MACDYPVKEYFLRTILEQDGKVAIPDDILKVLKWEPGQVIRAVWTIVADDCVELYTYLDAYDED